MIVVDTNIIAYITIPGPMTVLASHVMERDPDVAVPGIWNAEYRNVLATIMKAGLVELEAVLRLVDHVERWLLPR